MKVLHTSDWHLGMSLSNVSLIAEQRFFINNICDIVRKNGVDAVIIAGDVYDTAVSNAEAISLYNQAVNELCINLGVKVFVIAGNHDGAARLSSCSELLKKSGLFVEGKLKHDVSSYEIDNSVIYMIPHFNLDEVKILYPDEEIKNYEQAFSLICKNIIKKHDESKRAIAVAHAFIVGSELSDSDHSANVGTATAVSGRVFDGFDYVALGHIHKPQDICENIRYSGTPMKYSFGAEETHEKSVTILDTISMNREIVPLELMHDMRTVSGTMDEVMALESSDDFIRAEIKDKFAGLDMLSVLREKFPNILELSGKRYEETGETSTLTIDELGDLSEQDIVEKFFMELFDAKPDEEQLAVFNQVLQEVENGGDLS